MEIFEIEDVDAIFAKEKSKPSDNLIESYQYKNEEENVELITDMPSEPLEKIEKPKRKYQKKEKKPIFVEKPIIIEKPIIVEKEVVVEVEKPVFVEKQIVVEKEIEKPVYIDREVEKEVIIEKPIYIDREIEKEVIIEKEVEKPVYIEKEVIVEKEPENLENRFEEIKVMISDLETRISSNVIKSEITEKEVRIDLGDISLDVPITIKRNQEIIEVFKYKPQENEILIKDIPSEPLQILSDSPYNRYLEDTKNEFEIYVKGKKIFDSTQGRNKVKFDNEFFSVFGRRYSYYGVRIQTRRK